MIHEIGLELQTKLRAQGLHVPVVDGPEFGETTTNARERIVLEHDEDGKDAFARPRSQRPNPKHRFTRGIAAKLTIFARSERAGASTWEHRRRAEHMLDMVLCALDLIAADRHNAWAPTGGGFTRAADLEQSAKPAGAVYELTFSFDRAVAMRTWAGDARPEITLGAGAVRSRTALSIAHGPDDDDDPNNVPATAVTACGGD